MSLFRFYPYLTEPDAISLGLEAEGSNIPRNTDSFLQLYNSEMNSLNLRIAASLPEHTLEKVIAPVERGDPPVELRLIGQSIESRRRESWCLDGDGRGIYRAILTFDRDGWAGTVDLQAVLVRSAAGNRLPSEYGSDRGAVLSWSEPLRLLFDEPRLPPGANIKVEWKRFSELNDWAGPEAAKRLFAVDFDEQGPILYLNDLPELRRILESRPPYGRIAWARDTTGYMIIHQVWTTLLGAALQELAVQTDHDTDIDSVLGDLSEDWHKHVLRDWAPWLFPEVDRENALNRLVQLSAEQRNTAGLFMRVGNAIQDRFRTFRGVENFARCVENEH